MKATRLAMQVAFAPFVVAMWTTMGLTIGPLLTYIFTALGVGFITYTGFTVLFDAGQALVAGHFGGLPVEIVGYVGLAKLDVAASMLLSAMAIKISVKTAAGVLRKITFTG